MRFRVSVGRSANVLYGKDAAQVNNATEEDCQKVEDRIIRSVHCGSYGVHPEANSYNLKVVQEKS